MLTKITLSRVYGEPSRFLDLARFESYFLAAAFRSLWRSVLEKKVIRSMIAILRQPSHLKGQHLSTERTRNLTSVRYPTTAKEFVPALRMNDVSAGAPESDGKTTLTSPYHGRLGHKGAAIAR